MLRNWWPLRFPGNFSRSVRRGASSSSEQNISVGTVIVGIDNIRDIQPRTEHRLLKASRGRPANYTHIARLLVDSQVTRQNAAGEVGKSPFTAALRKVSHLSISSMLINPFWPAIIFPTKPPLLKVPSLKKGIRGRDAAARNSLRLEGLTQVSKPLTFGSTSSFLLLLVLKQSFPHSTPMPIAGSIELILHFLRFRLPTYGKSSNVAKLVLKKGDGKWKRYVNAISPAVFSQLVS